MSAVTPSTRVQLPPISSRRRTTDRTMRLVLLTLTLVALVPLVLVIYYLIKKGASSINGAFFTQDPTGSFFGSVGGARSAILGSIEIILMASIIAIPTGIAVGVYLTEYGRDSLFARTVRYFVDVMTGVPSIVFGLFIYVTLVISHIGGAFAGWKGAVAIALLMLPIVARSAEVVLQLVPSSLREAALALGAPRWRVIARVVLPSAIPGLVTGSLLAVARGIGETAPLLFTAATQNGLTFDPGSQMNSLPSQIYYDITSPQVALQNQAWACGLTLVVMVLILNLGARGFARRSRL